MTNTEQTPNDHRPAGSCQVQHTVRPGAEAPRWWHCDTHGGGTHTAWGCPECVRELRALAKEQAVEIERLRSALRGLLALDEDHSQRGGDDDDVCAEVQAARAALGPKRGTV